MNFLHVYKEMVPLALVFLHYCQRYDSSGLSWPEEDVVRGATGTAMQLDNARFLPGKSESCCEDAYKVS